MRNRRPLATRRLRLQPDVRLRRAIRTIGAIDPFGPFVALLPVAALEALAAVPIAAITIMERTPAAFEALPLVALMPAFAARRRGIELLRLALGAELVLAEIVAHGDRLAEARRARTPRSVLDVAAALRHLLLAERHDDAVVVLGVLEIVLGQHRIARRLRIPRQRDVFLGDMSGSTAQLDVRPRTFEAARQRVLALAVLIVVIVVVTAASSAVLLSLPHGLHSRQVVENVCWRTHTKHASSNPSQLPRPRSARPRSRRSNRPSRNRVSRQRPRTGFPVRPKTPVRITTATRRPRRSSVCPAIGLMRTPASATQIHLFLRARTTAAYVRKGGA